jgi:hypothetical protein
MTWQSSSRPNRLLFWSLVALAIAMVLAVAFAIRGFNRDVSKMDGITPSQNTENTDGKTGDAPMPEDATLSQPNALAGFVSGVISKENASEKWIELSVTTPESIPTDLPNKRATITTTTKTATYRFYLGEATDGGKDIKGGEQTIVSFFGEPSEKEYVGAVKIERQKE